MNMRKYEKNDPYWRKTTGLNAEIERYFAIYENDTCKFT